MHSRRRTERAQSRRELNERFSTKGDARSNHVEKWATGSLPEVGFLANTYVPNQLPGRQYNADEGHMRGTLFPGLDLPFQNRVNKNLPDGPMAEVMALGFAVHELGLYLDMHPQDTEALELFNTYVRLSQTAKENYEEIYGPLTMATVSEGEYQWSSGPWPWDPTPAVPLRRMED